MAKLLQDQCSICQDGRGVQSVKPPPHWMRTTYPTCIILHIAVSETHRRSQWPPTGFFWQI